MSRFYSETYKWSLYEKYRAGFTLKEICEISGITDKPLREWFRRFDMQYAQANQMSIKAAQLETICLAEQLKKKRAELTILQSDSAIGGIPETLRIACASPLVNRYGPNQVCQSLKIRKSNLFYHMLRKPKVTAYEKHNQELRPAIQKICDTTHKRIGADKIRQQLMAQNFSVSKRKVLELLKEILPCEKPPKKDADHSIDWQVSRTNILARQFSPTRPNMVWLSDITEIKTNSGKCYLCVVLDLFARQIISARLSAAENTSLVCRTFQDAFYSREKPEGVIFHSDQGGQYVSHDFRNLLCGHKVRQSFSDPGVPYDNAPMESFFGSLKTEEVYRFRYHGLTDLTDSLKEYLDFYNNRRPHSYIGNLTPVQAEELYYKKQSTVEHPTNCAASV